MASYNELILECSEKVAIVDSIKSLSLRDKSGAIGERSSPQGEDNGSRPQTVRMRDGVAMNGIRKLTLKPSIVVDGIFYVCLQVSILESL